jgi:hypothetical protein
LSDPGEVLAQMVAKISNADFHRGPHCSYIRISHCSHFVRAPCAMRGEMVVISGRGKSLKSACDLELFDFALSRKLVLGRSQRRSRRFESAHLHRSF